jgi:hypothetical protein
MDSIRVSEAPDPSSILGEATTQIFLQHFPRFKFPACRQAGILGEATNQFFLKHFPRFKFPTCRQAGILGEATNYRVRVSVGARVPERMLAFFMHTFSEVKFFDFLPALIRRFMQCHSLNT